VRALLTIRTVAEALDASPRFVRRLVERGELRGVRLLTGRGERPPVRVVADSLDEYLRRIGAEPKARTRRTSEAERRQVDIELVRLGIEP
jgi:excisionase family DNA binding protein